jgi:hypothetical protein
MTAKGGDVNTQEALKEGLSKQLRELYQERIRLVSSLHYINNRIAALKEQEYFTEENCPNVELYEDYGVGGNGPEVTTNTESKPEYATGGIVKYKGVSLEDSQHGIVVPIQSLCPKVVKLLEQRKYITSISPELR